MDKKDLPEIENATWIPLTQGYWALVDTEVGLIAPKFCVSKNKTNDLIYAVHGIKVDEKWTMQSLHRFVFKYYEIPAPKYIDHINGNGLDNRRCNLRPATGSQNLGNTGLRNTNTSGYRGVSWNKEKSKWEARISINGKSKFLGYFNDVIEAACAWDHASVLHFKEFAFTNFLKLDTSNSSPLLASSCRSSLHREQIDSPSLVVQTPL